ncbi:nicotinate-nucleotide--dimethylbenzimidazole phosphoribosyltransferase [Pseudothermotoga thermarum]|uniref:Nicotinate-nucleotide--dimethylbenzimidazole phosphoribosyltransferase n=1 Tax=Pseudothermotoga thermarum DSM 5069 TaxID=688269 RepID=F7YVV6_9THEM|nr:nicotinate-nucleotide--dimethylbenzimidazole phosphoribosyltransferase [Pseudothermotoga thermarum]AEH51778.1 nicotinate-nucleotide/dimethylbenzimidazole phosphoribosyltransferase [Pseudothermotoga thermarum DSM 5069]
MDRKELEKMIINRLNNLTKPVGSLGELERIALKIGLIQQKVIPELFKDKRIYVFAADHGVTECSISAYPREVTKQMVFNFLNGGAAINVFAKHVGAKVFVVDAGVDADFEDHPFLIKRKVGYATKNIAFGPAMSKEEAVKCIQYGREIARSAILQGADLLVVGDMGIGNTTIAAAIAAAFGFDVDEVVDIGTPIDQKTLERKKQVVRQALEVNKPDRKDAIDVLSKVGGFCIGQMVGFILEACENRCPVVVDGFPTTAALLIAYEMNKNILDFVFAGHKSKVKGHEVMLKYLGLRPILDLEMRLGEGTGAALAISIIEAAIKMISQMATFESAGVSKGSDQT